MAKVFLKTLDLQAWDSDRKVLDRVNLNVENKKVLSIIGPRGSGKSTLLRCLNRLFEEKRGHQVAGQVLYEDQNIYDPEFDLLKLRREFSMVFAKPTAFGHLSIFENVALGLRLNQVESGAEVGEAVEKAFRKVGLWDSVKDILHKGPNSLNRGDQQLLCLARCLVLKPKLLLMDEATSVIGLQKTVLFEQLIRELARKVPIIFTTSSRKQAARISDRTAFLLDGELIEVGKTSDLFMNPQDTRTEDYLTGRFG